MSNSRAARSSGRCTAFPMPSRIWRRSKGMRMTMGSPILKDFVPPADSVMVERLRKAGAIFIGKTNTPEFGLGSQHLQSGLWHHPQRLRSVALGRREQRRRGGGAGAAHAAARGWQRLWREPAQSGGLEQRVRLPHQLSAWCRPMAATHGCRRWACSARWRETFPISACCYQFRRATIERVPLSMDSAPAAFVRTAGKKFPRHTHRLGGDFNGNIPYEPGVLDLCKAALKTFESLGCIGRGSAARFSDRQGLAGVAAASRLADRRGAARLLQRSGQARAAEARGAVRSRKRNEAWRLRYYRGVGGADRVVSCGAEVFRNLRLLHRAHRPDVSLRRGCALAGRRSPAGRCRPITSG